MHEDRNRMFSPDLELKLHSVLLVMKFHWSAVGSFYGSLCIVGRFWNKESLWTWAGNIFMCHLWVFLFCLCCYWSSCSLSIVSQLLRIGVLVMMTTITSDIQSLPTETLVQVFSPFSWSIENLSFYRHYFSRNILATNSKFIFQWKICMGKCSSAKTIA